MIIVEMILKTKSYINKLRGIVRLEATHINAVCKAAENIFQTYFGLELKTMKPRAGTFSVESNSISVIIGVIGELEGQIICSFSSETAKGIVSYMMGGMTVTELDEMAFSGISEFGNWIGGNTATELSNVQCLTDVTPPIVNEGSSKFRTNRLFVTVPMESSIGLIEVHISLEKKE